MPANRPPIHEWLEREPQAQWLHFYDLLGLPPFSDDVDLISARAQQLLERVQRCQPGRFVKTHQKLLAQLEVAKATLTDASNKLAYDRRLREAWPPNSSSPKLTPIPFTPMQPSTTIPDPAVARDQPASSGKASPDRNVPGSRLPAAAPHRPASSRQPFSRPHPRSMWRCNTPISSTGNTARKSFLGLSSPSCLGLVGTVVVLMCILFGRDTEPATLATLPPSSPTAAGGQNTAVGNASSSSAQSAPPTIAPALTSQTRSGNNSPSVGREGQDEPKSDYQPDDFLALSDALEKYRRNLFQLDFDQAEVYLQSAIELSELGAHRPLLDRAVDLFQRAAGFDQTVKVAIRHLKGGHEIEIDGDLVSFVDGDDEFVILRAEERTNAIVTLTYR